MNILLIFFALPVATIILAIVLERVWGSYKLVTAFIFAIYLIIVFALFNASYLVYALIYTFLAFVASYFSMLVRRLNERLDNLENNNCRRCEKSKKCRCKCQEDDECESVNNVTPTNLLTISSSCGNGENNDLLTINTSCARSEGNNNDNSSCGCNQSNQVNSQNVEISARVVPNCRNNGRTGTFRGCYRRRCF